MTTLGPPGRLTVVLVDRADVPVPHATLDALAHTQWPGRTGEVVIATGRPAEMPGRLGDAVVRHVHMGSADGMAEVCNRALDTVASAVVAFVAAGAWPKPDWVVRPLEMLYHDRSIAVVAPGHPYVVRFDAIAALDAANGEDDAAPDTEREVLAPRSEVMICAVDALRAAGGFASGYQALGGAIELGWRLWLRGWRVVTCPSSTVDLTGAHVAGAVEQAALADALRTVATHYDDERSSIAVPAAMALAAASGPAGRAAAASFEARRAALEAERVYLQARRERSDVDIVRLLRPVDATDLNALDLRLRQPLELRWGRRRRIAVITPDSVGARMAGPAIRAWQMAQVLSRTHEVRLLSTGQLPSEPVIGGPPVELAGEALLREVEAWSDVLIVQGFLLRDFPFLRATRKAMVADVYDPLHLEQLELTRDESDVDRCGATQVATQVLNDDLSHSDFLLCASDKQRDFWLGQLAAIGRINPRTYDDGPTLDRLLAVVPFGLPDDPPAPGPPGLRGVVPGIGPDDDVIVWGGGIYNWFDPLTLVRAIDRLRRRRPAVRLYFMGMRHPGDGSETAMAAETRRLAGELALTGSHVFFNEGWVAYGDRGAVLLDADVGVSTHFDHVETSFSFRTRILDYLWAGLPVVATRGDSFGDLIEDEQLGAVVAPEDVDALEEALFCLLSDAKARAACRHRVAAVRERFTWPQVLTPLVAYCNDPRRAPDLVDPSIALARPRLGADPDEGAPGGPAGTVRRSVGKVGSVARRAVTSARAAVWRGDHS